VELTTVKIRSFLGLEEQAFDLGRVTAFRGKNASGKTSAIEAIKAALGRGNLASFQRVGSDEAPQVMLELDQGAYRIEKSPAKTKLKARVGETAAYKDVKQPQAILDALLDSRLSNPIRFLSAPPKERCDLLLEALPIEITDEALRERLGVWPETAPSPEGLHALTYLGAVRQALYDERTGVNRSAKDKESTAYELAKTVPARDPEAPPASDLAAQAAEIQAEIAREQEAAKAAQELATSQSAATFSAVKAKALADIEAKAAEIRATLERRIATMRAAAEEEVDEARKAQDAVIETARKAHEAAAAGHQAEREERVAALSERQVELEILNRQVGEAREAERQVEKHRNNRALMTRFETESASLKARSDALTQAISNLDAYKQELAGSFPIEGLEIRDGQIFVGGIPEDQLNTAERIRIAVAVAIERAKSQRLPILFVDGAEALDSEHFEVLKKALLASPIQAIIGRVEDGDLRIEVSE
jgi:flagellar biosynthesis GTPase FlhF